MQRFLSRSPEGRPTIDASPTSMTLASSPAKQCPGNFPFQFYALVPTKYILPRMALIWAKRVNFTPLDSNWSVVFLFKMKCKILMTISFRGLLKFILSVFIILYLAVYFRLPNCDHALRNNIWKFTVRPTTLLKCSRNLNTNIVLLLEAVTCLCHH